MAGGLGVPYGKRLSTTKARQLAKSQVNGPIALRLQIRSIHFSRKTLTHVDRFGALRAASNIISSRSVCNMRVAKPLPVARRQNASASRARIAEIDIELLAVGAAAVETVVQRSIVHRAGFEYAQAIFKCLPTDGASCGPAPAFCT
jgi:hypothetical protein